MKFTWRNWIKEIILTVLFLVEGLVTFFSFYKNWGTEISSALLFASIIILFNDLLSILSKFDNQLVEIKKQSTKEHDEIKGIIELYKDIEQLEYITYFEGNFVTTQQNQGIEIWIISNSVAEPAAVINEIYKNLTCGVKYYYIIPNGESYINDLKNTAESIKSRDKKNILKSCFNFIQDDLFDLMPTKLVDILFYYSPHDTNYQTKMRIFYSFQKEHDKVFYKPASISENDIRLYSEKMAEWKKRGEWTELI